MDKGDAAVNSQGIAIGHLALRRGLITPEQLREALLEQSKSGLPGGTPPLASPYAWWDATQIAGLLCPSEGTSKAPNPPWGTLNYVGNLGGPGTFACSGDMLLEALAACAGVTMSAVATSIGVTLRAGAPSLSVASNLSAPGTNSAPRIRRIASPGSYSALSVSGHDISIEGIEFDSDRPLDAAGGKVGV